MTQPQVLAELDKRLQEKSGPVKLNIRGHHQTPIEVVMNLTADLQRHIISGKVTGIYSEVSEKVEK